MLVAACEWACYFVRLVRDEAVEVPVSDVRADDARHVVRVEVRLALRNAARQVRHRHAHVRQQHLGQNHTPVRSTFTC